MVGDQEESKEVQANLLLLMLLCLIPLLLLHKHSTLVNFTFFLLFYQHILAVTYLSSQSLIKFMNIM